MHSCSLAECTHYKSIACHITDKFADKSMAYCSAGSFPHPPQRGLITPNFRTTPPPVFRGKEGRKGKGREGEREGTPPCSTSWKIPVVVSDVSSDSQLRLHEIMSLPFTIVYGKLIYSTSDDIAFNYYYYYVNRTQGTIFKNRYNQINQYK